jgi:hypothetical protein
VYAFHSDDFGPGDAYLDDALTLMARLVGFDSVCDRIASAAGRALRG